MIVIEDQTFDGKISGAHVFYGQNNAVDGAKSCIGDDETGQMKLLDHILQLDFFFIEAEWTEDSTASLQRDVILRLADCMEPFFNGFHVHWVSFQTDLQLLNKLGYEVKLIDE